MPSIASALPESNGPYTQRLVPPRCAPSWSAACTGMGGETTKQASPTAVTALGPSEPWQTQEAPARLHTMKVIVGEMLPLRLPAWKHHPAMVPVAGTAAPVP